MRRQRTFLELGAGTGIVSSRVAEVLRSGQDTLIVTDLPEVSNFNVVSVCLRSSLPRSALCSSIMSDIPSGMRSISIMSL
jgi:hypothetical protein